MALQRAIGVTNLCIPRRGSFELVAVAAAAMLKYGSLRLQAAKNPDPLKDPKNGTPQRMVPLLWGTGIIKGFPFLEPLGGPRPRTRCRSWVV